MFVSLNAIFFFVGQSFNGQQKKDNSIEEYKKRTTRMMENGNKNAIQNGMK